MERLDVWNPFEVAFYLLLCEKLEFRLIVNQSPNLTEVHARWILFEQRCSSCNKLLFSVRLFTLLLFISQFEVHGAEVVSLSLLLIVLYEILHSNVDDVTIFSEVFGLRGHEGRSSLGHTLIVENLLVYPEGAGRFSLVLSDP